MLTCARSACVTTGSLKELPEHWRTAAFRQQGALHCMRDHHKQAVMVAVAVEVARSRPRSRRDYRNRGHRRLLTGDRGLAASRLPDG
jgi:hypothetical protein